MLIRLKNYLSGHIKITERLYWAFFIFFIMLKCLYFQFSTKLNKAPYFSMVNFFMILSSFAVILILVSFIVSVFNKKRLIVIFIFDILLTVLLAADTNFFRYYYNLITIPVFFQFNPKMISSVDQSIMSLYQAKDIIYIVDLPLMLIGLVMLQKKGIASIQFPKRILKSVGMFVLGLITILSVYPTSNINAFAYNNSYSAKSLGVFYSHFHNTRLFIEEYILEDEELTKEKIKQVESYFKDKNVEKVNKDSKYKGIAKDKNLIIVQMEAIQQFVIGKEINGNEITPNLNRLIKESLYFNNIYYQVSGGNTSDAEFLCNTSLYPLSEGSVYVRYPENTYHSLPSILKQQGYDTYAFHGFNKEFWNREQMYKTFQFGTFFSSEDYIMDDFAGWSGNAISDKSFFRQSLEKIDTSKPFYSLMVTLSNHHPFTYFEDFEFDVGEFEGTYIGNYVKAANYADSCIGEFVDSLKRKGLYDDSLLVLYGDHSAVPKIQSDELMKFLGMEYSDLEWIKLQRVPLIVHYPGQQKGDLITNTGGQIDILPTIANLMDFEVPYPLGKDLINTNDDYVVLRNGSVITNKYVYFNDLREICDYNSGEILDIDVYEDELNNFINELNISDIIITNDALGNENE